MKYLIKEVSPHPLHIDSSCNLEFWADIKNYLGEEVLELFCQSFLGYFPICLNATSKVKYQNSC